MTRVEAILPPFLAEAAKAALLEIGIPGVTLTEVRGCGRQDDPPEACRGLVYVRALLSKIKLETVVPDHVVEKVHAVLAEVCDAHEGSDGLIFTSPVHETVRIRTAETGIAAISF